MKTQQTDNPRIKTIHDESGDYAVIDNSMIVRLDSTTRPPSYEQDFADAEKVQRFLQIKVDNLTAQRDELLAALKELRSEVHNHHLLDVKKRFLLCTADAQAGTAIHNAEKGE